eukprot:scaffold310581_cov36-Prasinocladus_malaysianus.AAC.1
MAVKQLASDGSVLSSASDQTARLWDPAGDVARHTLEPAGLALAVLSGLEDGKHLAATIAVDGCMRLWDLNSGQCIQVNAHNAQLVITMSRLSSNLLCLTAI